MGAFDDLIPAVGQKKGGSFDDLIPAAPERTWGEAAVDTGIDLSKGIVGLGESAVGMADLVTGNLAGKVLAALPWAYDPAESKRMLEQGYSPARQAANAEVAGAKGFVDTTIALAKNPSAAVGSMIESAPMMIGTAGAVRAAAMRMLAARGLVAGSAEAAAFLANPKTIARLTAIGGGAEGALTAGSIQEQGRQAGRDYTDTAPSAVAAGALTGTIGVLSSKIPGFRDAEVGAALAGLGAAGRPSLIQAGKEIAKGTFKEGVLEELPQSAQEQVWTNLALGKPWNEGVPEAAAQGMVAGAGMGGGMSTYSAARDRMAGRGATASVPAVPGTDGNRSEPMAPLDAEEVLGGAPRGTDALNAAPAGGQQPAPDGETAAGPSGAAPSEAEKALRTVRPVTGLDRVQEIDQRLAEAPEDSPEVATLRAERAELSKGWPQVVAGAPAAFSTETGVRLDGEYALIEADQAQASHDTNLSPNPAYPQELQPRDRTRAASGTQISGIVAKFDPARLGVSADAATGAPIIGADGLVESGNARTIALQRVYRADGQKADDYRAWLRDNAAQFGLTPEQVGGMRQPMLVRVRKTPVDRAEFARQANTSTVAQMSPSEQAKADAARIDAMDDLRPTEDGDFASSRDFIRRFMARLPGNEQAGMIDAAGQLSSAGYARVRNAILAKAYGDSPVLARMVESMDDNQRNITKALMIAAPRVAQSRQAIGSGRLFDADITPHLVGAVDELSRLKDSGVSVDQALAQAGLLDEKYSPETRELMQFLADNARRPRRMADLIGGYFEALEAAGDPAQGSLLGEVQAPTTGELLTAARRTTEGPTNEAGAANDPQRGVDREAAPDGAGAGGQPANAPGDRRGAQGDGAAAAQGEVDARAAAVAEFRAAAADLADIVSRHGRAAFLPENTPGLMPTLVRLFTAAIKVVGTDIRRARKWVNDQLKADPEHRAWVGNIAEETYQKAALQAVEGGAEDLAATPPQARSASGFANEKDLSKIVNAVDLGATPEEKVAQLVRMTDENVPFVKDLLKRIDAAFGTKSKDNRKAPENILSKSSRPSILAKKPWHGVEHIRDSYRFKTDLGSITQLPGIVRMLEESGVEIIKRDVDKLLTPQEWGWRIVAFDLRMPNGQLVEYYLPVSELEAAKKDKGHHLFELWRNEVEPEKGSERWLAREATMQESRDLYQAAWDAYLARTGDSEDDIRAALKSVAASSSEARLYPSSMNSPSVTRGAGSVQTPSESRMADQSGANTKAAKPPSASTQAVTRSASTFTPSGDIVSPNQSQPDLFGANDDAVAADDQQGAAGSGAATARGPGQGRAAGGARARPGSAGRGQRDVGGAAAAAGRGVGQPGPDGVRGADADGGKPGSRGRARRGAAVPAGRDLKPKSGLNYRLTDADLSTEGSWRLKAQRNVDAVKLLKLLQAEKRQATPEEQRVLARFIGWGASEIAQQIFSPKWEQSSYAIEQYLQAKAIVDAKGQLAADDPGYWSIYQRVAYTQGRTIGYRQPIPAAAVTKEAFGIEKLDLSWKSVRDELKAALTEDEWKAAARSTQYAHYTSPPIVRSMWAALERFGFAGGTVLEPGAGSGIFPGLMPDGMAASSAYTGIEFDPITGGILQQLQPDERILVESYVDTKVPKNFYDVAVGNPPFSSTKILSDPEYGKLALALHDYFFAKTIDRVKPGGLVMFVTSRYTMDRKGDKARSYMAERADLVGAIRLPQTAFKANAGTEVVTDVLFLRKKVDGETFEHAKPWLKSVEVQTKDGPAWVNEYFAANPDMVLGTPALQGSMYSANEYTVLPPDGDIEGLFRAAVERMPAGIYKAQRGSAAEAAQVREIDFNPKAKKEGSYYVNDAGVLMQREGGTGLRVEGKSAKDIELLTDYVPLRDALKQAHYDQLTDGDWEASLKALQKAYKAFTDKHGPVNQSVVRQVRVKVAELDEDGEPTGRKVDDVEERRAYPLLQKMVDDPDWTLVAALEKVNEETGAVSRGAFLDSRVLGKPQVASVQTPADALLSVLNDVGRVDMATIADRLDMPEDQAAEALGSAVYRNPEGDWETADEYLSGNVKRKLEVAEAAARTDRRFERNVEALKAAQPAPKSPAQINVSIGMNWIPGEDYAKFLHETTGVRAKIQWNEATRQWAVSTLAGERTTQATADWGTGSRHAGEILEHALTGRPIKISKTIGYGRDAKSVFDPVATEAANQKLDAMREAFAAWVWKDSDRTDRLVQVFNDTFNTTVPRSFDGRHLTLPGASKQFDVFDHVKRGAWRIVQSGNTYLAHAVGSGKTFQMVISAMEQKRLGMVKKPMVVVPNHMLQQFAREWQELYPAARLMIADEHNFHTDNRRRFVSRVALSDLDGVVITHSAFKLMDLDPEFKAKIIDEQLDYMRAALEEAKSEDGNGRKKSPRVKQIEKQIENLEEKLKAALSGVGKDKNVRFDELGVDFLYVDEAHAYRKLDFATSRQVKGVQPGGSAQALDLYIKARYLDEKRPGRSLVMASGTPVTNTLAELYTVQRFLGREAMAGRRIEDFDSWAAMFGRERTALEANAAGKYEPVTRFAKFVNVPELTQMFREFADVVTSDQLAALLGDKRPKVEGGSRKIVVTPKTSAYAAYQKVLAQRYEISRAWKPTKDEPNNPDPAIRIIGDGRLAAIDMRFINPSAPSDPDSKLNKMIDDVIAEFKATADLEYHGKDGTAESAKGATMMVFSDLGFGAGVAENRGFNARAWFEKRLRDAKVPMGQVAFMSDFKKSTDKLKLFRDLNAGRVRVLIGSSKNMGTGVNAQQRLLNLFHLDSPWFPADLEQREGRIIRQGNKNKAVRIRAYAAKGSYDETMWGMLARKQFFIDQALAGDDNLREVEDLDSVSQYDMAAALVAEDPRVLQLAGLKAEAEKLQRLYRAHEDQRMSFRTRFRWAETNAAASRAALPKAEKLAGQAKDLSGDRFVAKAAGQTFNDRTEWGDALLAKAKELSDALAESQTIGDVSGFPVRFVSSKTESSYTWHVQLDTPEPSVLISLGTESAVGMAMRATNAVADVGRTPQRIRERIVEADAEADALRPRLETPFPMLAMLTDKLKEAAELEAQIAAYSKDRTWRVERVDTGLGFDVQAHNAERAIEKAIESNGGTAQDWRATEAPKPEGGGAELAAAEPEPTYAGKTLAQDLEGQEKWLTSEARARGFSSLDDLVARKFDVFERLAAKWRDNHPLDRELAVQAPRQRYSNAQPDLFSTQLDLFAASRPVESQAGPGIETARRAAADALGVLRGSGTLLGRALAGGLAARQRVSLVGQVAKKPEDLATLAQVYRDPRFETFRLFFTDAKGKIVSQVGLTSRLPGSTAVIVGADHNDYVKTLAHMAKVDGAKRVWMLHNHPSGIPAPSNADRSVTEVLSTLFENAGMKSMGHVVIDTNKYGFIEPGRDGRVSVLGAEFGAAEPFAEGGDYAGQAITKPDDVMAIARRLQVEPDAVTLIALNYQNTVHSITTLPKSTLQKPPAGSSADELRAWTAKAKGVILRATLSAAGAKIVAVGRDRRTIEGLQMAGLTLDAIHVGDDGEVTSMATRLGSADGALPRARRSRVTSDTSPQFDYLRRLSVDLDSEGRRKWGRRDAAESAPSYGGTTPAPAPRPDAATRAEQIIQTAGSTPKPLDAVARGVTRALGVEWLTGKVYDKAGALLDRLVPETVKAGVVSDYGVPEAVIDRRARLQGSMREQLAKSGRVLEKLATMTRAESRVAYEWMNDTGEDPRAYLSKMQGLPEESVLVLQEVQRTIDALSKEAVRLGQLDADAFERHRFAYLRRSYAKHEAELTGAEKRGKARAISILGDQYKGRGMVAKVAMEKVKNIAPEWWKRKLQDGKADTGLKGEKFERLERLAPVGAGTAALPETGGKQEQRRVREVHYWPAGQAKPAMYADWESAGTWEVRDTKGGDLVLWRDFTKDERERMGEIDEARYAIAKTLHRMIHDVEVGRYLEWLAQTQSKADGDQVTGPVVEASELYRHVFKPGEWVQVPDTKVPGTNVKKYGKLAGRFVPGPVWNDVRQVAGGRFQPFGKTYDALLRMWKVSKTALSPAVHTNNVMSNFVMADWHDVSAGHVAKALRIILAARQPGKGLIGRAGNVAGHLGLGDVEAAREIMSRYETSGGAIGGWVTQEIANDQLAPIVEALQKELNTTAAEAAPAEIGVYAALQHLLHARFGRALEAFKASRPAALVATDAKNLIDLYQAEDDVFRLAAWLKAKEGGMADAEAGKVARRSFLDYSINAPWVQMMRATALPFVSYTYRALPMLAEIAGKKPHKILKLMALAGALNWVGVMLGGGGDDRERRLLPEEKAGGVWGMVPKLIRMPWNDANGSPVYLDIRRWIPVGDVFDMGQGHSALPMPPAMTFGGPLALIGEIAWNKSLFTGKDITLETDTLVEQAKKTADHLWKAFMPNILGMPGTYATQGVLDAAKGRTDAFGRELSVGQAVLSSAGIKVGSYPEDVLRRNIIAKLRAQESEIDKEIAGIKRQAQTKRISLDEAREQVLAQEKKKADAQRKVAEKLR